MPDERRKPLAEAAAASTPGIADIAPYAAFGAFYFLVSAIRLAVTLARKARSR